MYFHLNSSFLIALLEQFGPSCSKGTVDNVIHQTNHYPVKA